MESDQLTRINTALNTIDEDNYHYSEAVKSKLEGLSEEEQIALAQEAAVSTRKLAEEVLEQHQDGQLSLGEMGDYIVDVAESSVSLYRDREFQSYNVSVEFGTVFYLNTDRQSSGTVREAFDAQETMQAIHSAVIPKQN